MGLRVGRRLADLTWPTVPGSAVLLVPTGSCEQHGPHLPFDTDTRIAVALASGLADRVENVVIAPPIGITASGEHQSFPGTLSIGVTAFEHVVVELGRSALPPEGAGLPGPFSGVLFVNGHGGNVSAFRNAVALLRSESRDVQVWHPVVEGGDSHAGRTETSIMLHIEPDCVRLDLIEAGSLRRWREIATTVAAKGLAAVSPNGVLGDPRDATADEGERVFVQLLENLHNSAREWFPSLSSAVESDGD